MIDINQRKSLQKLINSDIIKNIYPVIGDIDVHYYESEHSVIRDYLILDIYLNNPEANKDNMWDEFQLDEHYLIDHHIRKLLPYIGIDNEKTGIRYRIYDTDYNKIKDNILFQ
jgi:hypothetical protein